MARAIGGIARADEPVGVPLAIPTLVVMPHAGNEPVVEQGLDDLGAEDRMLAHQLPLMAVQAARLQEDPVGHADLADVVEVCGLLDVAQKVFRPAELLTEQHHVRRHAGGMAQRVVVLGVERRTQGLEIAEVHALDSLVELGVVDGQGGESADGHERRLLLLRPWSMSLTMGELESTDHPFAGDERHDQSSALPVLLHQGDLGGRQTVVVAALDLYRRARLDRPAHGGPVIQREPLPLPAGVHLVSVDAGHALKPAPLAQDVDVAHRSAGDRAEAPRRRDEHLFEVQRGCELEADIAYERRPLSAAVQLVVQGRVGQRCRCDLGEAMEEVDALERTDVVVVDRGHADHLAVADERQAQHRAVTPAEVFLPLELADAPVRGNVLRILRPP